MSQIPDLADLLRLVQTLPPEEIPALMAQCAALQSALAARLASIPASGNGQPEGWAEDQLLTAEEASRRLGISKDSLYRRRWPFEVRPTPGVRRFSAKGIERYIRARQGR